MRKIIVCAFVMWFVPNNFVSAGDGDKAIKQFSTVKDGDGNVVYIQLDGRDEIEGFLRIYSKFENRLKLKTILVTGLGKDIYGKPKVLDAFVEFLKRHGSNLENLHISGTDEDKLSIQQLLGFLTVIDSLPVKDFRWENQETINVKGENEIAEFNRSFASDVPLWKQLRWLSLKGTTLRSGIEFIAKTDFPSLTGLDLSHCGLDTKSLSLLLDNSERFPMLSALYLNDIKTESQSAKQSDGEFDANPVTIYSGSPGHFSKLRTANLYNVQLGQTDLWNIMRSDSAFFAKIENLSVFIGSEEENVLSDRDTLTRDGAFIYRTGREIATTSLSRTTLARGFPRIKFQSFSRCYDKSEACRASSIPGSMNCIFANQEDIDLCMKNYTDAHFVNITLFSPSISREQIDFILAQKTYFGDLKNIFLVSTSVSADDLGSLRAANLGMRFHIVSTSNTVAQNDNYFLTWQRQLEVFQMLNEMNRAIKLNFPKFRK